MEWKGSFTYKSRAEAEADGSTAVGKSWGLFGAWVGAMQAQIR